ncbi:antitoxin [Amycolatopsis pithecellobii]|uniref:Antitoxin n=1 Tax=Amycolatopsis pithecellobii TaxID=664692 RepID=A0A6N7YNA1_9PSEU|nr:antitoxin [Amycolatopsis pithecellobii]MTD53492.1 antitoxin [Amycolatopsis pithecellobii]
MNLFDKAKEAMGKHPDQADQGIDKAADAAKSKWGEHGDQIDQAAEKAKGFTHQPGEQEPPPEPPPQEPPA